MALHLTELPVDLFSPALQPFIARFNEELKDVFGLEGAILDPRTTNRSDRTIARSEKQQVDATRVANLSGSAVTSISANDGVDVVGDINLVDGFAMSITRSLQDFTIGTSAAVLGTTAGDITTIQPDDAAAIGGSTASAPVNHRHAIAVGVAIGISNVNTTGDSTSFAASNHQHALGTAGDENYLRRDGGNTITGNITPDGSATRTLGGDSLPFTAIHANALKRTGVAVATRVLVTDGGVPTEITVADGAVRCDTGKTSNAWQTAQVVNALVALENITTLDELGGPAAGNYAMGNFKLTGLSISTASGEAIVHSLSPLNDLAAQTATYDCDGQTLTDWGGCPSSNAAVLPIVSNVAVSTGVAAIELRWNPGTTETVDTYNSRWTYNDGSNTFDLMRLGIGRIADRGILWFVDKDEDTNSAITEWTMLCGSSNVEFNSGICAISLRPDVLSGAIDFFSGGQLALRLRRSGSVVQIGDGYLLGSEGVFGFRMVTQDDNNGSFQFGTQDNTQNTAAWFVTWTDKIAPGSGDIVQYRIAGIRWDGGLFSGRSGSDANIPADGFIGAHGWIRASTSDNQGGVDFIVEGGGPGTGNSTAGGDTIFMTPNAGSSGTAIQALTEKARLTREGELLVGDPATSTRDVLRYALLAA